MVLCSLLKKHRSIQYPHHPCALIPGRNRSSCPDSSYLRAASWPAGDAGSGGTFRIQIKPQNEGQDWQDLVTWVDSDIPEGLIGSYSAANESETYNFTSGEDYAPFLVRCQFMMSSGEAIGELNVRLYASGSGATSIRGIGIL